MVSMIPLPRTPSLSTLSGPSRSLREAFPPDGSRSPPPPGRPPWAPKPRNTQGAAGGRVSAAPFTAAAGSAESKHRLWLFTTALRRPRTAFGVSPRAEALPPLQTARTPRKSAETTFPQQGTSPPTVIP